MGFLFQDNQFLNQIKLKVKIKIFTINKILSSSLSFLVFSYTVNSVLASMIINKEYSQRHLKIHQKDEEKEKNEKDINEEIKDFIRDKEKEYTFTKWSKDEITVAILTFLAGANVEVLSILGSQIQIFGLNFNTGLSQSSSNMINWGTWFNLLAEDIPQIIIQVHNCLL